MTSVWHPAGSDRGAESESSVRAIQMHPLVSWSLVWGSSYHAVVTELVCSVWYMGIHYLMPMNVRLYSVSWKQGYCALMTCWDNWYGLQCEAV